MLLYTQNIRKGLHNIFKPGLNDISQVLPTFGEYGSNVSYLISYPRNFSEVNRLSYDINKTWLKASMNEIKNLINNQTFLGKDTEKGEPVNPCMDVYKSKIKSNGGLDHLKMRILVKGDL